MLLSFLTVSYQKDNPYKKQTSDFLEDKIMIDAQWAITQEPVTITAFQCERSKGGIHDFYSEGDYWWVNPNDPDGPYIRRDGETNPDNFVDHRLAMIRFSKIVGYLASAYLITKDETYVEHAFRHIKAWFIDSSTYMNPNLLYAQAIKGVTSGRGIGIIDTIHLMEVAQGILRMQNAHCVNKEDLLKIKQWFNNYIKWLTTHPYGVSEMKAKNNHGTCWVMQVACFAKLTDNSDVLNFCRERYKNILLPNQMAEDGSFPQEISRTKPYGYSLFNLDAMVTICQILSTQQDNLWEYTTDNGLNIKRGIDFLYPFIKDKSQWPYGQDVMYWEEWPIAQPTLIFASIYYENKSYFDLWKSLQHTIINQEVERNLPIRNPLIWI